MAKAYYAWSPISLTVDDKPKVIARGAKVTASGLGISDDEFQAMIQAGSVRPAQFPAPDDYEGSALDWHRDQLVAASTPLEEAEANAEVEEIESVK